MIGEIMRQKARPEPKMMRETMKSGYCTSRPSQLSSSEEGAQEGEREEGHAPRTRS